jgi:UDP-N-acetylglucosamine--N-acetylmuramyl-(pentapeptide) pyrophosphoryl-undecaprenol N-acetylglucosamine transferase
VNGERYALVAGGGTAGHLQPAIAIAEALVEAGHPRETIEFVGSARGQDRDALDGKGFPTVLLPGRGVVRSLKPKHLVANARAAAELLAGACSAYRVVARARPRVVVSVGGYASVGPALAAVVRGVPLVLVNVDAVPGAANRLFARAARACAVGWDGTPLPRATRTGTPVRPEIAGVDRSPTARRAARRALGLPEDRSTVVVVGGSLGARSLNEAATGLADRWAGRDDRAIYHVVGRRDWERFAPLSGDRAEGSAASPRGLVVRRVPYEDRMEILYAAADVAVCRAGAMTVAELAVAGVPSLLVPLPGAPGDHQGANARVLVEVGGAVVVRDDACTGAVLADELDRLLEAPGVLARMERAVRTLGRPEAANAAARLVETTAAASGGSGRR